MAICVVCGGAFRAKRADARLCSQKCRKAASRRRGAGQNGHVTDNPGDSTSPPNNALCAAPGRLSGEPFTFAADSIPGRRWRVDDGHLECETGDGWMRVMPVADQAELAGAIACLSGAGGNPPSYGLAFGARPKDVYEWKSGLRRLPRDSRPTPAAPYGPFGADRDAWVAWAQADHARRMGRQRQDIELVAA